MHRTPLVDIRLCLPITAIATLLLLAPLGASSFAWEDDRAASAETAKDARLADLAQKKDWSSVSKVLGESSRKEAELNAAQPDGMTALHWAVFHGDPSTAKQLLEHGANANAATQYDITPLAIACSHGSVELSELLLKHGADAEATVLGGESILMIAARTGNAQIVRALSERGVELDHTDRKGQTALMWAAAAGNLDAVDVLINAGADLDVSLKAGFTAFTFAAREGHIAVVDRFLKAGMDVNFAMQPTKSGQRVPRKGTSALLMAVESGHFELAMFLVNQGADPNDQRSGYGPLHVLSWVRKPARGEDPSGDPPPRGSGNVTSLQFVRALVEAGGDVNLQLEKGKGGKAHLNHTRATPLLLAGKTCDLPLIKLLVELGADPKIPNVDGCTALMAAAGVGVRAVGEEAGTEQEVIDTIEYLIDQGLDVNHVDSNRETAMHGAAYRNFPRVVDFLASHGSDSSTWNHKNVSGWTPVMIAQGHRPGSFKPSPVTVAALEKAMHSPK